MTDASYLTKMYTFLTLRFQGMLVFISISYVHECRYECKARSTRVYVCGVRWGWGVLNTSLAFIIAVYAFIIGVYVTYSSAPFLSCSQEES